MAKVYAIFDDDDALRRATDQLDYKSYEIIAPQGDLDAPDGDRDTGVGAAGVPVVAGMSATGGSSTGAPVIPAAAAAVGETAFRGDLDSRLGDLDSRLGDLDLSDDERRSLQSALQNGSQILVIKKADSSTVQMLKEAGASSVSSR